MPQSSSRVEPVIRAIITGMLLGGLLSLCNIYTGLKVGWGMNISITAALMGYGVWQLLACSGRVRGLTIQETNLNQTAASAAAAISSAGLVAPIPALTMINGHTYTWIGLVAWTFSVSIVGVVVGIGLRRQLIVVDQLPFPGGMATAETLREIYAHGKEAAARLWMLIGSAAVAAGIKIIEHANSLKPLALGGWWSAKPGGALAKSGVGGISSGNLGFALEPTVMMYGVGMLIGPRVGISMLIGAVISWGVLAPMAFDAGWMPPGKADPTANWFVAGLQWLLWPGVAMMVASALTSFAFSWRSFVAVFRGGRTTSGDAAADDGGSLTKRAFISALVAATALAVVLQVCMFDIAGWAAFLGVMMTFVLALVAARVSGETNITPVGAMGKVTQLAFAVLAPGQPAANLMAANVTGGAASQCADLMHDLKTGHLIGTRPQSQFIAQFFGVLAGAMAGSAGYLVLIKDPLSQLLTPEWPAPSVAAWKAVAELFMQGLSALPPGAVEAMTIAGVVGIVLAVMEKTMPVNLRRWLPSSTSLGLAMVIPAYNAISMFLGSMVAWVLSRWVPDWSTRFVLIIASGLIAGESLSGVVISVMKILGMG
jgi:putative OPT family oligopeptide transporter